MPKNNIIKRKGIGNLEPSDKWIILIDYVSLKLSNSEIATKHSISEGALEDFIRTIYRKFLNAKETKALIGSQSSNPNYTASIIKNHVSAEVINEGFLAKLSTDEDVLTDAEILFSEFLLEYGDDVKAIEKSKLNIGLKKYCGKGNVNTEYADALIMRSFYLKRKPNISLYIADQKKKNIAVLKDGKEYLQSSLIGLIDQLRNSNDPRQLPSMLKAIELTGRTMGAFDDKLTLGSSNGDDVLDAILAKAKQAEVVEIG
jgi:hypothetical protein